MVLCPRLVLYLGAPRIGAADAYEVVTVVLHESEVLVPEHGRVAVLRYGAEVRCVRTVEDRGLAGVLRLTIDVRHDGVRQRRRIDDAVELFPWLTIDKNVTS